MRKARREPTDLDSKTFTFLESLYELGSVVLDTKWFNHETS